MKSLIAHIARKHGIIGRENLATEVLAYILGSIGEDAVRGFLGNYGYIQSSNFRHHISIQKRAEGSRCIPDVTVKDDDEKETWVLIENKFEARFTDAQRNKSYLNAIQSNGLLLFIVPEKRRRDAAAFLWKCYSAVEDEAKIAGECSRASVDERRICIASWKDALEALERAMLRHSPERHRERTCSDLEQLRRFCEVAELQTFGPLKPEQIKGQATPNLIRHMCWITGELISKCIAENIVEEKPKRKFEAYFGDSLDFGQHLQLSGVDIWMGCWIGPWEEHGHPLWIVMDLKAVRLIRQARNEFGNEFAIPYETHSGEEYFLIAIPLRPNVPQDEVVEGAFQFVSDLQASTRSGGESAPI